MLEITFEKERKSFQFLWRFIIIFSTRILEFKRVNLINRLFLLFILVSCGNRAVLNSKTTVTRPPLDTELDSDFDKFKSSFNKLVPTCLNEQQCPKNLVFLGFYNPSTALGNYCNGLVVSNGHVAVPSKCISRNLLSSTGLDCSKAAILKDPNSKKNYECKKVASIDLGNRSDNYESSSVISDRDYIVFEFPGVKLHKKYNFRFDSGFQFNIDYNLYYYELGEKENSLKLKTTTCTAIANAYINPLSNSRFSPNISVNCPNENLNKRELLGAILVNGERILGFYYHPVSKSLLRSLRSSQEIIFDDTLISANGSWMNFSCWDYLNPSPHNECFVDYNFEKVRSKRAYFLDFKISDEQLYSKRISAVQEKYYANDQYVKWNIVVNNVGLSYEVTPKEQCFHRVDQWPEDMKKKFSYEVELNKHIVFPQVTNRFIVNAATIEREKYIYFVKFNSKKVKKLGVSDVELTLSHYDIYGNRRILKKEKIKNFPVCQ